MVSTPSTDNRRPADAEIEMTDVAAQQPTDRVAPQLTSHPPPAPASNDQGAAAAETEKDQDTDECNSVLIRGHSFLINTPSRRSTMDASGVNTAREVSIESNTPSEATIVAAKQPRRSSMSDAL